MGSATAWQLAKRGREVVLLERFSPGHKNGASHGESRNFSVGYVDDVYLSMVQEARTWWNELEDATGTELLTMVGTANHGPATSDEHLDLSRKWGIEAEMLTTEEAGERWPGIRFDTRVLYNANGGRVNANRAVTALQAQTAVLGGTVNHDMPARSITVLPDGRVEVVTDDVTYLAKQVVTTVGAWTEKMLGQSIALPTLVVTQEQPAHFAELDPTLVWPSFNHSHDPNDPKYDYWYTGIYGMQTPGEGIKAGWHGVGAVVDPDARTFVSEAKQLAALQQYARDWLPGVDADDLTEISCTYTTTPDSNFILDRRGPIIVGAGFSGHGFKFTPTVGRILADLVDGSSRPDARFALGR
jgi:sarcosine oxidase